VKIKALVLSRSHPHTRAAATQLQEQKQQQLRDLKCIFVCVCLWQAEIFFHCQNRAAAKSQIKVSGSASQREREHSKLFTIVGIVCFLAPLLFVIVF